MSERQEGKYYRLGLIGYPLGHSLSPRLHMAALAAAGLQGEYLLYPVAPDAGAGEEILALIERIRSGDLAGLNVTIPHKQTVLQYVDDLEHAASAAGAVNTLVLRDGRLIGANTDVPGFLHDLRRLPISPGGPAVVLGAGGSARAVVYALASEGRDVIVAARRKEQAENLVREISKARGIVGRISSIEAAPEALGRAAGNDGLVVNTTPLGMHPLVDGCPWPEEIPLPPEGAVYDLVYNPAETTLAHRARAAGLPVLTGAGMLAAQAALSFHAWTGTEPPYEVMQNAFQLPLKEG